MRIPHHHHDYQEYLQFERDSPTKHEYINGDIIAMTGGSLDHAGIAANVTISLGAQLRGKPCRVFSSDLRIRINAVNVATYPDVSVVCGRAELDAADSKGHTVLNPVVIVEVLSPSTAEYDCGEKLEYYKQIPALRELVLIDYEQQRLLVWRRGMHGAWWPQEIAEGAATLESIGCTLSIADVYRNELPSS